MTNKVEILNVTFDNYSEDEFIEIFKKRIDQAQKTFVVTANPEIVMNANKDAEFMGLLQKADFTTADGEGIITAGKMLNQPLKERVTGYDLMERLLAMADENHYRVYLLGAKDEVIQLAKKRIETDYAGIKLVGVHHGYFELDDHDLLAQILTEQPQLIFVGTGSPKQEKWIQRYLGACQSGLLMGVGGSFDVFAGTKKRAPLWVQRLRLEWFYRLLQEPWRYKRMMVLPKFIRAVRKESGRK